MIPAATACGRSAPHGDLVEEIEALAVLLAERPMTGGARSRPRAIDSPELMAAQRLLVLDIPCHRQTSRTVTIHPREIEALTALGRLDQGWQIIGEMTSQEAPKIGSPR